ncbi:MAG: PAS domain S-box protein [Roseiflexus sp.]|nr:PAS domain S-box protein [Roseiflexus sp.]MDW8233657.1 PAS domain S-box protein [Roseiflexaceae bacterium]
MHAAHESRGAAGNAADPPSSAPVIRRITIGFALALGSLAIIALIAYGWTQSILASEQERFDLLAASGLQRIRVQQIALAAEQLMDAPDPATAAQARETLSVAIDEMAQSHQELSRLTATLPPDDPLRRLYTDPVVALNARVQDFLARARRLRDAEPNPRHPDLQAIRQAALHELPPLFRTASRLYIEERRSLLETLNVLHGAFLGLTLLVLAFEGVFIVRPMVQGARRYLSQRDASEARLRAREKITRALYDVTSTTQMDHLQKVQALLRMGCDYFRMSVGMLTRIDGEELELIAVHDPDNRLMPGARFPLAHRYCAAVIEAGAPISINHAKHTVWRDQPCHTLTGMEAYIGAPLQVRGMTVGTLCFASATPREAPFTDGDYDLIRLMAQWIGSEQDRLQTEAALRESEERFALLSSVTTEGVVISERGIIVDANAAAGTLLGYPPEQLRGMSIFEFTTPEGREKVAHALATGYDRPYEVLARRGDGTLFPAEVTGRNIPYHGRTARVTTIRDMSRQRLAEAALRASEERFRQLAENVNQVFWMSTPSLDQILYVNPAYEHIWGRSCDSLYAQPSSLFEAIIPEDRERVIALHRLEHTRGYSVEFQIQRNDGQRRWILTRAFPVTNETGSVYRIAAISEDVTERKHAEEELRTAMTALEAQYLAADRAQSELRAILDASSEAIALLAPDGAFLTVNRCFCDMFGVAADQVLGQRLGEMRTGILRVFDDAEELYARMQDALQDTCNVFHEQVVQRKPQQRELSIFSAPVWTANQVHIGRLYIFRDITHERAVERMKSEFVAMVSHELRTPLTSIKGFVDMLLDGDVGPLADEHQELLRIVKANTDRLLLLINDLLDMSRIEAGKLLLHRAPLDVRPLIRQVVTTLRPQLEAKQQHLHLDLPETLPDDAAPLMFGDAVRVHQILTNLLSNAIKYTPQHGQITVRLSEEPPWLCIAVQDTGVGLTAEEQERIFDRFYRARNRATREAGGTGLGLTITRSLVELHQGHITIESEPGKGSTFRVYFPLLSPHNSRNEDETPAPIVAGELL